MKKSQFSEAKIVEILALPSQGQSIDEICHTHNISPAAFYNWCQKYGTIDTEELRKQDATGRECTLEKNIGWQKPEL